MVEASADAAEELRALFVGREDALQHLVAQLGRVAGTTLPVLLEGPAGVGKSLLALAIHQTGNRRAAPFQTLDARELAGQADLEHGWSAARGGSLHLRHVDLLSDEAQRDLLERLKSPGEDDPRLLATVDDANRAVGDGLLLEPLLDRLRVLPIRLGPLRDERQAIPHLFQALLRREAGRDVEVEEAALRALARYRWPGNVRQVEEAARSVLASVGADGVVTKGHAEAFLVEARREDPPPVAGELPTLEEAERRLIESRLARFDWAQQKTADSLGIDRKTLYRKIRRYGLQQPRG